jgi:cell division protein FtsI (penicillin-binding protein 3)
VYKAQPTIVRRVVPSQIATLMTKLLVGVIEEGSGMLAKCSSISVAGKTGTANKCVKGRYVNSYICSFVCFFPAENPVFVVGCMIDEPKGKYLAGEVLGYTMKNIIQKLSTLSPYREKINET